MIYGHDGFAGEFGHVIVERGDGRECGCGRKGCLETYVSAATGIKRTAFGADGQDECPQQAAEHRDSISTRR